MNTRLSQYEFLDSTSQHSNESSSQSNEDINYYYDKNDKKNIIFPSKNETYSTFHPSTTLKKFPISNSFYKNISTNQKLRKPIENNYKKFSSPLDTPSTCRTSSLSLKSLTSSGLSINNEFNNDDYSKVKRKKNFKVTNNAFTKNDTYTLSLLNKNNIINNTIDSNNLENIYKNPINIVNDNLKYYTFSNEDFKFGSMVKITSTDDDFVKKHNNKGVSKCFVAIVSIFGIISFLAAIGFMIALIIVSGEKNCTTESNNDDIYKSLLYQDNESNKIIGDDLIKEWNGENIRNSIRWLSEKIHVAGTDNNRNIMDRIEKEFKEIGLEVTTSVYDVLLDYPDYNKPNTISYCDDNNNNCKILSNGLSNILGEGELYNQLNDDHRSKVQWLAYAKNGTVSGSVVYANYGKLDDYEVLDKKNISLKDKIVIVRYGGNFRADKVNLAAVRGAKAVVIYSDPHEYAPLLGKNNETFPDNIYLPDHGAQRGTLLKFDGDPLTPFFPSKDYVMRTETEEEMRKKNLMPKIPATPIGYGDAMKILKLMDGDKVDIDGWSGNLNVTYRFTGSKKITVDVRSGTVRRQIKNVIGRFVGEKEPDKWVMLGNHVDAWVKGSIDPNSGTATLLEAARVLRDVSRKSNWKPRRSIVFCAWDAEEYGLIGSTEFVEEYMKVLQNKAIVYLNVDNINGNNSLLVKTVPMLYRSVVEAAQKIPHPNPDDVKQGLKTLYDGWQFYNPKGPLSGDKSVPEVRNPGSGSDFQRFISYIGIPVLDLKMQSAPMMNYMLYHTMYEVPWTTEHLIDPTSKVFSALGGMWLELARNVADSLILPFNIEDYSIKLDDFINQMDIFLKTHEIDKSMSEEKYQKMMNNLKDSVKRFNVKSIKLQDKIELINNGNYGITIKQQQTLNNILQSIEKSFIIEQGIYEERAFYRHAVFAPNQHDSYAGKVFSLIMDPATEYINAVNNKDKKSAKKWLKTIELGFTKLQYGIESAILNMDLGVLFALKILMNNYYGDNSRFMGIPISGKYYCWVELFLIQMVTPNASFLGHLCGIIVGLIYMETRFLRYITMKIENILNDILPDFNDRYSYRNDSEFYQRREGQYGRNYGWRHFD